MSALTALPQEIFEELYLTIPKSMHRDDIINALVADERSRLEQDGIGGQETYLSDYRHRLDELGPLSLADMAYETCLGNNTFDAKGQHVWLDRAGTYQVNPNDIYRHTFAEGLYELHDKLKGFPGTAVERRDLRRQIDQVCQEGRGVVTLAQGALSISFNAEKRVAKITKQSTEIDSDDHHLGHVRSTFGLFVDRCLPKSRRTLDHTSAMER
ncbi:hypothetical protein V0M98_38405 (plasmid) [Pseudomonas silesiensis]|uniref:hypothetical protein n=1 Tax=Pseudomonas silesiensis TaxID=1853130 RepID=UPI0030D2BE36